jgi:hypothetical protein
MSLLLGVLAFVSVLIAQRGQGMVRDEVHYMNYGSSYAEGWGNFFAGEDQTTSKETITKYFGGGGATDNNREHPPLMKTMFGISERLLSRKLEWASPVTAYRLPTALMFGVLVFLVALFASGVWGLAEGLIAGLLLAFMPRLFFHAGLATFDVPVVTAWFATLYAYYKALQSRWWVIGFGVLYGLALATKHNAVLMPAVIVVHYAWVAVRSQRLTQDPGVGGFFRALVIGLWKIRPSLLIGMLVIGPLVFVALWPWMWFEPTSHVSDWLSFHLTHVHYNFEYLGQNWNAPPFPWHIAIVTTVVTVPVATMVAGACGAVVVVARSVRGQAADAELAPVLLLFLSAGVAMGPFLLRTTPIFGAEKHWAAAMPTITVFAAVGLVAVVGMALDRLRALGLIPDRRDRMARLTATAVVGALVVFASIAETRASQPYGLSHYNALAGGAPGGADMGMNRQFWGYSARGVLPWLSEHAPKEGQPPAHVYSHDASPTWGWYHRMNLLPRTMPDAGHEQGGIARSKFSIVVHEKHFNRHDYLIWNAYKTVQPAFVLTDDGVPIVTVYARDPALRGPDKP